ncbi:MULTISPECIES: putative monovalent cation/H+ antiporter subunit A [Sphingobacterium]|uniref:putative monovalent cation/H+ antiporter subunit A n=1 Tax=Sphingobacterium TaxID=28453 RepID=UPI0013DC6B4E|nr:MULTISPECIES: putative monovalent cation/H+ antiporter subunit A [unclassified Sphingobacterium]
MLLTILSGLISACSVVFIGKYLKSKWSFILPVLPALLFLFFAGHIPLISSGNQQLQHIKWVPSLGVNFEFKLDGLSLLFSLLITGIGTAIFVYARSYLKGHIYYDRFFSYLFLFMSAMLGVVLSDNIILLFIFWELTSISSFFLIGFNNDNIDSRKSALTALSITGLGGFFLLASLILLGNITGTYSISEMINNKDLILNSTLYPLVIGLLFIGAFTKSAQFPFHFWLPGAMKAPTPVSAYLHSATMVKAGIYLLARFTPILGGTDYWSYTLMIIGGVTMLYASIHALFRIDLKEILAYSTISALGILTFLIGIGTQDAFIAAMVFLLAHGLYKATLFMVTGIIDHETGTRDITVLSGLRTVMPPVALAAILAALSSAGVPFTFGFIGKDLVYEATLHSPCNDYVWIFTGLAITTNVGLIAAGFMAGIKPFVGKLPSQFQQVHLPNRSLWIPPLLLALLGIVFGILPSFAGDYLSIPAASSIGATFITKKLQIWHFNLILILSIATLLLGSIIYVLNKPSPSKLQRLARFDNISPQRIITRFANGILRFANWFTNLFHNGYLRSYHLKIILFAEVLLAYKLWVSGPIQLDLWTLTYPDIYEVVIVAVLIGALYIIVTTPSRLTSVVSMSVIGYCICLIFVIYSAPDLAMTQFTIDTLSTVLFVLVLYKLPGFINFASKKILYRDALVSIGFGITIALVALKAWSEPIAREISNFYGENAYLLAKGKNVVNVILVDFRGIDTMFETVVLSIAALGVYSLIRLRLKSSERE